jgi:hypothetical protein
VTDAPHLSPGPVPPHPSGRQLLAPGLLAAFLAIGVIVVLVLAQRSGDTGAPARPGPFATPAPFEQFVRLTVQSIVGDRILFEAPDGSGTVDVELSPSLAVDLLRRADPEAIGVGDWVLVTGVANEVRNFAIRELVVFPGANAPGPGLFARTPAGFTGHEASADMNAVPVLGGVVTEILDGGLVLDSDSGPIEINFTGSGSVPVRVLEKGSLGDLVAGSRVAIPAQGGQPDPDALGILVTLP